MFSLSAWECIYPGDEALSGGRWPFLENLMKKETGTWNTRFPDVRAWDVCCILWRCSTWCPLAKTRKEIFFSTTKWQAGSGSSCHAGHRPCKVKDIAPQEELNSKGLLFYGPVKDLLFFCPAWRTLSFPLTLLKQEQDPSAEIRQYHCN